MAANNQKVEAWYAEVIAGLFQSPRHQKERESDRDRWRARDPDVEMQVLRGAVFLAAYSVLERFLTSLCRDLEAEIGGLKLNQLAGQGIRKAHLYLTAVAEVKVPEGDEWERLLLCGELRHAVVHAQGELAASKSLKNIKRLQSDVGGFKLSADESSVTFFSKFNWDFIAMIQAFAEQFLMANGIDPTRISGPPADA